MKYSEAEMAKLISEVEEQFASHLAKAEQETATNENQPEKVEATDLNKSEESTKSAEAENVSNDESSLEKSKNSEDNWVDYDEKDLKEVETLYSTMNKNEVEIHFRAIKKALFGEDEINKSENQKEKVLQKSENEEKLQKENEELKKSLETLTATLTNIFKVNKSAPKQKAITKLEYITKSENEGIAKESEKIDISKISSLEISKRLSTKIRTGSLSKSEREKINAYYNKEISIGEIEHLL